MAFFFSHTAYNFPAAWSGKQRAYATNVLKNSVKYGGTAADVMRMFDRGGVAYRKQDMLIDIARAKATEQSKSREAYNKASSWFDSAEKVRLKLGLRTRKEAAAFMQTWKQESWKTIEEAKAANELEAEGYTPSPKGSSDS